MDITGSIALVTGANRGLGGHLVDVLLERGAATVYAAARDPRTVEARPHVVPIGLDLTDPEQIAAVVAAAGDLTLLVNNASTATFADPFAADREALVTEMATNYLGTYDLIRALVPTLERNRGAVVNVLSLLALASTPPMAGYSASKAALHSMTQAIRPGLAARGVAVHGVYPGGIDTEMMTGVDAPKTAPRIVAENIVTGLVAGEEDIFPDPTSEQMGKLWAGDPKAFERAFAGQ